MNKLEKHKMLALSTAHLSEDTRNALNNNTISDLVYYEKGKYGWFMPVIRSEDIKEYRKSHPNDLLVCIEYATKAKCDWIMFDRDVEPIDDLPVFYD